MDKLYIVMPAYNESANIESVVDQWHPVAELITSKGHECKVVIANDGSRDDTYEKLQHLQLSHPHLMEPPFFISTVMPSMLEPTMCSKPTVTGKHFPMSFGRCGTTATNTIFILVPEVADRMAAAVFLSPRHCALSCG